MTPVRHVLIVGGGITGLSAAVRLAEVPDVRVTVVEQSPRLGGKLLTGSVAGRTVESGAEAFLARRPETVELAARVGLADRVIHPAPVPAGLYVDGALRELPRGTVMGVPADPASIAGVVTAAGLARAGAEPIGDGPLLAPGEDAAVGALVRHGFGDEVVDRLVDPLLGGVYAGRADDLSVRVAVPQLAAAAQRHRRLSDAVRDCLPPAPEPGARPAPVFGSIEGGLSQLVAAAARASGARILTGLPVRELSRTPQGWRAVLGATRDPQVLEADRVVLAVPARPAARLLAPVSAAAAAEIGRLDYAGIGLVTLALPEVDLPRRSGLLVPPTEGLTVKAATFFDRKWPATGHDGLTLVRMSIGRYPDVATLQRDDSELVAIAHRELSGMLRMPLPEPVDTSVDRWGGALPQYGPGHLDRIRRAREALADQPILLAGAAFDGVGIPACVASGTAAAVAAAQL